MDPKPLEDEALDTIVGGSSYISQLQNYLSISTKGMPCFSVLYHKEGDSPTSMTHVNIGAAEMGFKSMISLAENNGGSVTLISVGGKRQEFSAEQLRAML